MRKYMLTQLLVSILCFSIFLPQQLLAQVANSFQTPDSSIIKVVEDSGMKFESIVKQDGKTILTMSTPDQTPVIVSIEFTPPTQPNTAPKAEMAIEYAGNKVYQEVTQTLSQLAELFKNAGSLPEKELNKRASDVYEPFVHLLLKGAMKLPGLSIRLGQKALSLATSTALGTIAKVGALMMIGTVVFSAVMIHGQWDDGMITGVRALEMLGSDFLSLMKPAGVYGAFLLVRSGTIRTWFNQIPGVSNLISKLAQAVRKSKVDLPVHLPAKRSRSAGSAGSSSVCEDLFSSAAQLGVAQ